MLLAISLAFATSPADPTCTPDPAAVVIPDGVVVIPGVREIPLLVVDGRPAFAQKFASLHADTLFDTIPGYHAGSLAGLPLADASVYVDGVRFDIGGRLGR